ncbi:hypothetical protein BCR44DRAFT_1000123 [Catenaria anguillulae PL171]|uniref:Uncharacterized protein n=1 Tax=Catenaria anguillulae PL171 TaxID=765915 RepID=A0A1Y2I354_9FUNG|nr:hypothetical protein BCR44DRAFT_1000123 [Catenaria anguillulae PL171]
MLGAQSLLSSSPVSPNSILSCNSSCDSNLKIKNPQRSPIFPSSDTTDLPSLPISSPSPSPSLSPSREPAKLTSFSTMSESLQSDNVLGQDAALDLLTMQPLQQRSLSTASFASQDHPTSQVFVSDLIDLSSVEDSSSDSGDQIDPSQYPLPPSPTHSTHSQSFASIALGDSDRPTFSSPSPRRQASRAPSRSFAHTQTSCTVAAAPPEPDPESLLRPVSVLGVAWP